MNVNKTLLIVIVSFLVVIKSYAQTPCKVVIGYYPSWQWYDRSNLVKPTTIDYSQYTILNYAFLKPQSDGSLMITDPWSDKNLLLGTINWGAAPAGYDTSWDLGNPSYHNPNTSLSYHAHQKGVEVMMSIGGWTLSNLFPEIAADPAKRTTFAHNCNKIVRLYGLDGIDIDWEYPGYTPHDGTPSDKVNFTLLMQEVRDSLDALQIELSTSLKLTAAFGTAPDRMADIEWDKIIPLVDYVNLMSYDFFGAFSPNTNHNAPLYPPAQGDSTFNIHSSVQRLINDYSVPANMINVGVAFYGRSAKTASTPGLHVPTTGEIDGVTFSLDEGSPMYYNVLLQKHLFDSHWDASAKVPYLTGKGTLNTFLSYDDEKSIGLKGKYVADNNLAGVIIWEITGDYIESVSVPGTIDGTPLADTLNACLCKTTASANVDESHTESSAISLYPNPCSDQLNIHISQLEEMLTVDIYNSLGANVYQGKANANTIDISNLSKGVYWIRLESSIGTFNKKIIKM